MEVLILSKTHFGFDSVCVGGMVLSNAQYVRLLTSQGCYQFVDTKLNVGDIWDMKFTSCTHCREPHNEDVMVMSQHYLRHIDRITQVIKDSHTPIWEGTIDHIFESKLHWTQSGVGYLSVKHPDYPCHSVGFWLSNEPLTLEEGYYWYPTGNQFISRKLRFKGVNKPLEVIPAHTLIRVSMAKWWKPENSKLEERCYTQLSGWYE
ncbi:MAG: hypothetical protein H7X84_13095 [Verrucomicrobia bacterium]|nr:hypothetical protein [Prolixibacteraceae bacterium]